MSIEQQRCGDLGNGYFYNPVLRGDYPDPSIIRVGKDYYMTHSMNRYAPGLLIWHSRDLVNWEPVCTAITEYAGDVWAPELVHYQNRFYIYYWCEGWNYVTYADQIEGPWSAPKKMEPNYPCGDPGHIVDVHTGAHYLVCAGANTISLLRLSDDGLSFAEPPVPIYEGWQFPKVWAVEGKVLESPKLFYKDGYYYLTSADGGTAGPATSHMVLLARAKCLTGPYENAPHNPIVHTRSRADKWWSRGHATAIDAPDGTWWLVYHAYEKDNLTLGRQTLLEPLEWTDDGWYKIKEGALVEGPLEKPKGEKVPGILEISDDFRGKKLQFQWRFDCEHHISDRYCFENESLVLTGKAGTPGQSSPQTTMSANHSYRVQVKLTPSTDGEGGLILFYNQTHYCGLSADNDQVYFVWGPDRRFAEAKRKGSDLWLRIDNMEHDASFYYSFDGDTWDKVYTSVDTSGYTNNMLHGFLSLRIGLFATAGTAAFQDFTYMGF